MAKDVSNEKFLNTIEQEAAKREKEVHGCGRCVLATLMDHFELGDKASADLVQKAMLPLSGGIVQKRNTCAAALGGLMGIGMVYFPGSLEDAQIEDIMKAMALGRQYYSTFEKALGHIRCYDIREAGLGRCFDTADPDEYEKFVAAGGYELCSSVVGKAARLAAEFMLKIRQERDKT
jgi:C_GCAxxG_C_C family probable redox protein